MVQPERLVRPRLVHHRPDEDLGVLRRRPHCQASAGSPASGTSRPTVPARWCACSPTRSLSTPLHADARGRPPFQVALAPPLPAGGPGPEHLVDPASVYPAVANAELLCYRARHTLKPNSLRRPAASGRRARSCAAGRPAAAGRRTSPSPRPTPCRWRSRCGRPARCAGVRRRTAPGRPPRTRGGPQRGRPRRRSPVPRRPGRAASRSRGRTSSGGSGRRATPPSRRPSDAALMAHAPGGRRRGRLEPRRDHRRHLVDGRHPGHRRAQPAGHRLVAEDGQRRRGVGVVHGRSTSRGVVMVAPSMLTRCSVRHGESVNRRPEPVIPGPPPRCVSPNSWRRQRRPPRTLALSPALERRPVCQRTGAVPSHALDDAGIHQQLGERPRPTREVLRARASLRELGGRRAASGASPRAARCTPGSSPRRGLLEKRHLEPVGQLVVRRPNVSRPAPRRGRRRRPPVGVDPVDAADAGQRVAARRHQLGGAVLGEQRHHHEDALRADRQVHRAADGRDRVGRAGVPVGQVTACGDLERPRARRRRGDRRASSRTSRRGGSTPRPGSSVTGTLPALVRSGRPRRPRRAGPC